MMLKLVGALVIAALIAIGIYAALKWALNPSRKSRRRK